MKGARATRDTAGRYTVQARCDGCGKPIHGDHFTDDEVCDGGDGPGFLLCSRKRCQNKIPDGVEARRAHYTKQRAANDAAEARDTVTNEQIRALLTWAKAEKHKATIYICKIALDDAATHLGAKRIARARARCAEIINARRAKEGA